MLQATVSGGKRSWKSQHTATITATVCRNCVGNIKMQKYPRHSHRSSAIPTTGREICSARVRRSTAMTASDGWYVQRFRWNTGELPINRMSMQDLTMRHNPQAKLLEYRRIHPLQESFRFRSTVTTEKVCVMRWKKTAVSSSFYITKTVKLWQKKPAMEQSQGISVDLESSVPTARRRKLIITMYPMSREASHMSCQKMQRY